ncbi:MAG TPA: LuxR C-terminal-related transcriptional regulator [Woeseiaceae bacterium]|nr:LuxR C-terminal-related transcriptional regulator [Woeseiaceae bacterium]
MNAIQVAEAAAGPMTEKADANARRWFISAKLDAPRQQVSLVSRLHLLRILDTAIERRLCVIVAPAGFGKTTLVSQWRNRLVADGHTVAWLSLDEDDAEVRQLLAYVILALSEAGVDTGRLEMLAAQGLMELSAEAALGSILSAIAEHRAHTVLALDDYHRIAAPAVDLVVNRMVDAAPPNFTLIVASRVRPDLAIAQRLVSGRAIEIDADMLRFSEEETRAVVDPSLTDDQLKVLFERTEGWAVAVQLARLTLGSSRSIDHALAGLSAQGSHLAGYLADQVLSGLDEDLLDFMTKTAVLERFNAPLANAVCGRNDAWSILNRLEPLQSLLVPLDDRKEWFRYHHLFADHLQVVLQRRAPESIAGLHLRASEWHAAQGYVADAVRHARLAGDLDRAARLIEDAGGWELMLYGGIGYLRNLVRSIPDREALARPRIQVARAYLALKDGRIPEARAIMEQARVAAGVGNLREDFATPLGRDMVNVGALLDMYEDQRYTAARIVHQEELLARIPPSDKLTLGVLSCTNALVKLANGAFDEAEQVSRQAMRAMRAADSVLGLNYCFLHAGGAALYLGRLRQAEANFRQARQLAEDNFGADSGLRSLAELLVGTVLHWRDAWDEGYESEFDRALSYVESYDGWFEIFAHGLDTGVAAALQRRDIAAAEGWIARAERTAAGRGMPRLSALASGHRLWLHTLFGDQRSAARLAASLAEEFTVGCWKHDRFRWRPWQIVGPALAYYHAAGDRALSLRVLDDVIACCRALSAGIYLVQALAVRADILAGFGQRREALDDLVLALELAAPEGIRRPFRGPQPGAALLRAARRRARDEAIDAVVLDFIGACLESEERGEDPGGALSLLGLSPREREVIHELVQGQSNKTIARTLDLTEHTVKFHLKNIFRKLDVSRRAEAIARVRDLGMHGETYPNE